VSDVQTSDGTFVEGLDRSRHLGSGPAGIWIPRAILVVLLAFAVAALLNAFGQRSTTSSASAPVASLSVLSPERVRVGLLYQTRIAVRARTAIQKPTLVLDRGYFEATTFNGAVPDPMNWGAAQDGRVKMQYDKLNPGDKLVIWLSWQANPPNGGRRSQDVLLADGTKPVAEIKRSVTVFP
jgi:hypothetical protein